MFFARNLTLQPGELPTAVTARAQNETGRLFTLRVEYVEPVPGQNWVSAVIVRLNDQMANAGEVSVWMTYRGLSTNSVRVFIGDRYALAFDGSTQSIMYENFWQPGTNLGMFFYELWVKPGRFESIRYLLSDGIGGSHAILLGLTNSASQYLPSGNIWSGSDNIPFGGDDGPAAGEWAHIAVGWDGTRILTYYNGVPVGESAFAGERFTPGNDGGGGRLFIGGSNHQNFIGEISQLRAYEGTNPHKGTAGLDEGRAAFAPDVIFEWQQGTSLLTSLMKPASIIPDLTGIHSPGIFVTWEGAPLPQFVIDAIAPRSVAPGRDDVPTTVQDGARVFDSFSRNNSTYAFDEVGGLGATESGLSGRQTWRVENAPGSLSQPASFGILNGKAVILSNGPALSWVPTGSGTSDLDIRVSRHPGAWGSGVDTGLAFRVRDAQNFCFAYTTNQGHMLNIGCYSSGVRGLLITPVPMPDYVWTTLRVMSTRAEGGAIRVYADQDLVATTSTLQLVDETGAGLYNNTYGMGLANRWDNFAVLNIP